MPLFKKKSVETSSSQHQKTSPSSSEESTPSLLDFSEESSPVLSKDHVLPSVTDKPTLATPGSPGKATILLQGTDSKLGNTSTFGSSPSDPLHPQTLSNQDGTPLTGLSNKSSITEVLSSGEKGLGTEGTRALDSLHSVSKLGKGVGNDLVVGEAQGLNPEFTARTSKIHSDTVEKVVAEEDTVEKESSGKSSSWFKRLVGKGHQEETENPTALEDESTENSSGLSALTTFLPQSITGVNISALGLQSNSASTDTTSTSDTPIASESSPSPSRVYAQELATDKYGKALPTHLTSSVHPTEDSAQSTVGSIKDKIQEDHDLAPKKTNGEFHQYFEEIPEDDELIEDYRCALQRDILVQGRLFVSENNLAFRANIFGVWSTTIVIPWSEVVSIEKKMTAIVIPNAISISTIHATHTFASFLSRDTTYEVLIAIYRHHHPGVRNRSNTTTNGDGAESVLTTTTSTTAREKEDNKSELSYTDDEGQKKRYKFKPKIPEALKLRNLIGSNNSGKDDDKIIKTEAEKIKEEAQREPGSGDGHKETIYTGPEYANTVMDINLRTSPVKVFNLMFKDDDFLKPFWNDNQGLKEIKYGEWTPTSTSSDLFQREMSYIKPLNASMGPKQTLCQIKDENEKLDEESWFSSVTTTVTPDVPSGSSFKTVTRTVLTWNKNGGTRIKVTTEVEWSKVNRMLKGIIERSCIEGQKTFHKDLETAMKLYISSHASDFAIEGAEETPDEPIVSEPESTSFISEYLSSPLQVGLGILIAFLILSNIYSLLSLRSANKVAQVVRLGSPGEVASAVNRVLDQFKDNYARNEIVVPTVGEELKSVLNGLGKMEKDLNGLTDRVKGLIGNGV